MAVKTKNELNAQFPDNTTRQITPSRLRDLVDTTFDMSNRNVWRVYHVNQGVATDDTGDGTYNNPFYTVHAALEKMNEEKALLGILPGQISTHITRIILGGGASGGPNSHYESLLITRQEYVQWQIHSYNYEKGGINSVVWRSSSLYCNVEDYNGWKLPPLMITNMKHQDFVDNFLKYNWDTRIVDPANLYWNGKKQLTPYLSYTDLYGENPYQNIPSDDFMKTWSGLGVEMGEWQGGPLIGETFYETSAGLLRTTFFQDCELKGLNFNTSNFFNIGCLIISGRNSTNEIVDIDLTYSMIENCTEFYFKNIKNTNHFVGSSFGISMVTIFENAIELEISNTGVPFPRSVFKLKRRDPSIEGGGTSSASLALNHLGKYTQLSICGNIVGVGGYSSNKISLPHVLEIGESFTVTGDVYVGAEVNKGYMYSTRTSSVHAAIAYFATTGVVNLFRLTSRILCKGNTGTTTINEAIIGEYPSRATLPNTYGGSGVLLVAGTLHINSLTCIGSVLIRTGSTANFSGMITGNLTVAAGATLNAVSLTVKGNVILETGATITWKGGTFTGTLTDPAVSLGGATAGSYINV